MSVKTQSQATINAIVNLASEKGYDVKPHESDYKTVMTKADTDQIVSLITQGLTDESVSMTEKSRLKFNVGQGTPQTESQKKALKRYVVGLVNDRLRKAKAINGNVTYQAKEPGKLTNSRDAELKALTQVLALDNPDNVKAEIQSEIDRRKAELAAQKAAKTSAPINYDCLPADLRAKLGI